MVGQMVLLEVAQQDLLELLMVGEAARSHLLVAVEVVEHLHQPLQAQVEVRPVLV
jgi:hypothetical protein